jgi:hypothetical protein
MKCRSPLMVGIKNGCQQIFGGNFNLMSLDLSLDEAPATTKSTNAFCLRKVCHTRDVIGSHILSTDILPTLVTANVVRNICSTF